MALDTYANLKTSIKVWTHRDDLDSVTDDFIDLCEGMIYSNTDQGLLVREMETSDTTAVGTQTMALPTGFIKMRKLTISVGSNETDVRFATPESLNKSSASGQPKNFTVTSQIEFDRSPDATYTFNRVYLAKATALSTSNTTNAILTNYPQIYLQGCLWAAYMYTGEEEKASSAWTLFINGIRGANKTYKKGFSPASSMRSEASTP